MIKIKPGKVKAKIKIPDGFFAHALARFAQNLIIKINKNTDQGVGYNGQKFPQYSDDYADKRHRAGRDNKQKLRLSGDLFRSIRTRAARNRLTIFFTGVHRAYSFFVAAKSKKSRNKRPLVVRPTAGRGIGNDELASSLNSRYRFWGVSMADRQSLLRLVRERLRVLLSHK